MKQLTCEMCGSTDLMKQDGVFVCQSCGTKYSVEEAKKMMVEGTVDVSGSTVKVDNTAAIGNYMKMANSAYEAENNKEAESYCNKIIEIDPTFAEAWLLKGIASAWQSTGAKIRIEEFLTCAENAFKNAKSVDELDDYGKRAYQEYYNLTLAINKLKINSVVNYPENWKEYLPFPAEYIMWDIQLQMAYGTAFNEFYKDKPEDERVKPKSLLEELGLSNLREQCNDQLITGAISLWNSSLKDYNSSSDGYPTDYALERMMKNGTVAMLMLGYVIPTDTSKIKESQHKNIIRACKNLITMKKVWMDLKSYTVCFSNGIESHPVSKAVTLESKQQATEAIKKCHEIIKICDPTYVVPTVEEPKEPQASNGGCYVATAVYGSYDCPQVWTLRRFRDNTLAETWYGRAFIRTYYAISPTLVKWFGHTEWFKKMWRGKLDRMVENLKAEGVEDTPYEDRNW